MDIGILKKLGFTDKCAKIYLALLRLGPSSVRRLAQNCDLNRGTTYDALKWLQDEGIVTFYQKDTKQYFVAEKPEKLLEMIKRRDEELHDLNNDIEKIIPELQALHNKGGERPVARYFEKSELHHILEDVLETCEQSDEKRYCMYSSAQVRGYLYQDFSTFSDVRISKGIKVNVIAIGDGGELRGLDERKHLHTFQDTSTCIIVYPGKTAYISLDAKGEPVGVVIENEGIYETQKLIFDNLWNSL